MSFSPRVHKKNNIKYSNAASNALLNLAQTKAAETIILESMLQSRLDKIERAKKKGKKFGMFKSIVSKIIPGKLDDAILSIADAAYKDRLRSSAFGGIDTGEVTLLADAAREIDSQARGFSEDLMKDMKFSSSAKNFVSEKMMAQLAELPEIKKAQDKFNSLGLKEKFIPKNMLDFVKSASDTTAQFMKNPVGFMKRYERDPITKELQYKGTASLNKFFSSTVESERKKYQNEFNRLRKEAGLDMSVYNMLETPEVDLQFRMDTEIDETLYDFGVASVDVPSALDVITQETDAGSLMLDNTLLQDIKQGLPEPTKPAIQLSQEIEDMADDLPIQPNRPVVNMFPESPEGIMPDLPIGPDRPEMGIPSEAPEGMMGDINLGLRSVGSRGYQTNITYDPKTLEPMYTTSEMQSAVDTVGDTLLYKTSDFSSNLLDVSRRYASSSGLNPQNLNSVPVTEGMTRDDMISQFSGFNEPFTRQQMFDKMSKRDQRKFRKNNPNMFQRKR